MSLKECTIEQSEVIVSDSQLPAYLWKILDMNNYI